MPSHSKSAALNTSSGKDKRGKSTLLDSLYIDFEKDGREADARFADIDPEVLADVERAANSKRKRTLTAKAKAALEQGGSSSDEPHEPLRAKKMNSRVGKRANSTSAFDEEPRIRPPDVHPASLVRLRSPGESRRRTSPPKVKRKYKSYSDAVSGASASSEDDAMSIGTDDEARGVRHKADEAGSLVDFIDDRAEEQLSVYSAGSLEEPPRKKSKESKKQSGRRHRSDDNEARDYKAERRRGIQRHNESKGSRHTDPFVVSDDDDRREPTRGKAPRKHGSSGNRPNDPILISDNEDEDELAAGRGVLLKRKPTRRDRTSTIQESRRSRRETESNRDNAEDNRGSRQTRHIDDPRRKASANANLSDADSEEPIDWPPTPEGSPRHTSNEKGLDAEPASSKGKGRAKEQVGNTLLPGQDPLLADTYDRLEPLKDVELVPLFGSQVPPEEEALKLSHLIRPYKNVRGAANLQERLISMITFQQKGVFVNGARASLNKVTTKGWGTSTYFVIPPSVVPPRNGALPFHACFLMTGVCAYSYLFSSAQKSFSGKNIVDHRIGLYPIEFEYQRALSYIGNVAKKYTLRYSFTSGILAFATKTEASSEANTTNFGASPKKSAFHRDRETPAAQSSAANPALEHLRTSRFPAALTFQDKVPVFDARGSNFITGQFDFSTLHALPLITTEVDESSVITVGFTCNTYVSATGNLAGADVLSMNVQFVVVHAGPPPSK